MSIRVTTTNEIRVNNVRRFVHSEHSFRRVINQILYNEPRCKNRADIITLNVFECNILN